MELGFFLIGVKPPSAAGRRMAGGALGRGGGLANSRAERGISNRQPNRQCGDSKSAEVDCFQGDDFF
jgi:hypothetical protein